MRSILGMFLSVAIVSAVPLAASAQPAGPAAPSGLAAQGFLLRGAFSAGASLPISLGGGYVPMSLIGLRGSLGAGVMYRSFAATIEATYGSVSGTDSSGGTSTDSYAGDVTFGPRVEVFFWRSLDDTVRISALVGADFGDIITKQSVTAGGVTVSTDDDTFVAGLDLGVSGSYFVHPNVVLGLALGSHTDFIGASNTEYLSGFFASFSLGFVAGS